MASLRHLSILLVLAAGTAQAQGVSPPVIAMATETPPCRPSMLVRMTVRNITPGLAAADPRAQPKRIWRQGALFLRSLEPPLPPTGDQTLVIIAEPDIWTINTAKGIGRHAKDPGPVFEVHAPIVPPQNAPPEFLALEYGCEAEFVAVRAPKAERTIKWGSVEAGIHIYTVGEHSVAILMDDRRGEPLMVSYVRGGRPAYVVRYDEYQRGLPDQPELFRPPADATISDVKATPRQPRPLD